MSCPKDGIFPINRTGLIVVANSFTFGSNATYSCQSGMNRNISGPEMIMCLANGNWSALPPSCPCKLELSLTIDNALS